MILSRSFLFRFLNTAGMVLLLAAAWVLGYETGRRGSAGAGRKVVPSAPAPPSLVAEKSPQARRQEALGLPGGLARRLALMRLNEQAGGSEDARALLENGRLSPDEYARVLRRWAERDPAACWAWWSQQEQAEDQGSMIFECWARRDWPAALQAMRGEDWEKTRGAAEHLLTLWAEGDSELAPKLEGSLGAFAGLYAGAPYRWAMSEEREAIAARLLALPAGSAREILLPAFAEGLFHKDWSKAVAFAQNLPEGERASVLEKLAATGLGQGSYLWGNLERPPEREAWALRWLEEEAGDGVRARLGKDAVRALQGKDPAAALAKAQEWLAGAPLVQAVAEIVGSQAHRDAEAARAVVENLPPGGLRAKAAEALAMAWIRKDPGAAVEWALAESRETGARPSWDELCGEWAAASPQHFREESLKRAAELPPEALLRGTLYLVGKDAPAAMDWAARLPEEVSRKAGDIAMGEWVQFNPQAAAQYVAAHPGAPVHPGSYGTVAGGLFFKDAEAAISWAEALPAGSGRDSAFSTLREKVNKEPDAARRAAWQKRLPED